MPCRMNVKRFYSIFEKITHIVDVVDASYALLPVKYLLTLR
jgi:hypothetical protein